ncbi:DNA integrity scanning protein DisA nucleotide-binding domain protein [Bacillus sp. Bva_UNVM-123]|uniref:DNA integrity scanning protein DisA nucleotide-binding domain protein n=1 Tax=Bacillus sp. Bva_UNVM-123 TaxID=2829798 RepID=UPI00391F9ACB
MNYLYPYHLTEGIKKQWNKFTSRFRNWQSISFCFPADENLLKMLDVMYHVSFEKEEGRYIVAKVAYMEPSTNLSSILNFCNPPIELENVIKFGKSEIIRLSPAVNSSTSILVVCPENLIIKDGNSNNLVIWGVLFLGNEYDNLLNGRADGALTPPFVLSIEVKEPGELIISSSGEIFCNLNGGKLTNSTLKNFGEGLIGLHFSKITDHLYKDVCNELKLDKYSEDDSNDRPKSLYYSTLKNILRIIEKKKHGGTLIVIPENKELTEEFKESIHIKYRIKSPEIWENLIDVCKFKRLYFDVVFKKGKEIKDYKQQIDSDKSAERAKNIIFEHEEFIAALSGVDGAVVINEKFEIIGFGAEIRLPNDGISTVRKAKDAEGREYTDLDITSFGTRHRSAIRFCNNFEDSIAFVISQDGKVKCVKRNEGFIYLWDDVNLKP